MDQQVADIRSKYKAILIGVSAGGMDALPQVLSPLPEDFPLPILIVQHSHPSGDGGFFVEYLNERCRLEVIEATDNEPISNGKVYLAPADLHLVVADSKSLTLSSGEKINHSRPSIDVLFDSAVDVYHSGLIGIILTGATPDGAKGMRKIEKTGGLTIAQDPATAKTPAMPQAAIDACSIDYVLPLEDIPGTLVKLLQNGIWPKTSRAFRST
ncbi:MAG: chemotaxis protein CheB [Chloroflexi bacterium]|jgi:two-component system, chemotaxis family, protein-glutamate methylesterase/glutaminase|nr:chemotaxis protein CheB [Chloroflexota bacterium]